MACGRSADIDLVQFRPGPGDQLVADKDRHDEGHVILVLRPDIGVVADERIAVSDARVLLVVLKNVVDDGRHRAGLGEGVTTDHECLAIGVHHGGIHVADFGCDWRARHEANRSARFVVDGPHAVPENFEVDGIETSAQLIRRGAHQATSAVSEILSLSSASVTTSPTYWAQTSSAIWCQSWRTPPTQSLTITTS